MTRIEVFAALAAAALAILVSLLQRARGQERSRPTRASRFFLWLAIAMPLVFLLTRPEDRPRILVSGPNGQFQGLRLLALCAAAGACAVSLLPATRRWWTTILLIFLTSLVGLCVAYFAVR